MLSRALTGLEGLDAFAATRRHSAAPRTPVERSPSRHQETPLTGHHQRIIDVPTRDKEPNCRGPFGEEDLAFGGAW